MSAAHASDDGASGTLGRILVVRLGSMGDILHTLPAVAVLRHAFPEATLGWVVEERWTELLAAAGTPLDAPLSAQKPLVNRIHVVDTLAWRTALFSDETWSEISTALRGLRAPRYEVAVDFQGAFRSAALAQTSGAPRRLGFMQPREKPASLFYTHPVAARGRHIIEQLISLAEALAPAAHGLDCPLPYDPAAEAMCERELRARGLGEFAIINPGAGWGAKCWPAERYGEVVRALAGDGLPAVINYGPGEEELAQQVVAAGGGAATTFPCTLGELISLTRRARLFIGGDTGPMHLAAALAVPVVALFGPTDPVRNGPFSMNSMVLRSERSQTNTSHRAEPDAGLMLISAEEVIAAARQLTAPAREVAP